MNILFIYDAPLRPENGGTERATQLVLDELNRRGHNCMGILHFNQQTPDVQYFNGKEIPSVYDFLKEKNIEVVVNQIAFHPRFLKLFLANGGQQWKDEGGKIVSFMHLDPTPAPRKSVKKYFLELRYKSFLNIIKRLVFILYLPFFNYINSKEYRKGLRFLYKHSDRYVLMSNSFIPIFTRLAKISDVDKICIIPNMLTFSHISSDEILNRKENMVLIVARLDDEQKNISFMLDAWNMIDNHQGYTLHIVGDGRDKEKLYMKAINVKDIVFEGHQSPLEWYEKSKIFLMASPREGWGLTITESLQNGVVPLVLNTSAVFSDIISHGKNGYLVNTKMEFVQILTNLLKDEVNRNKIALEGLYSATRFTQEKVGNLWESMLNEMIK